MVRTDISVKKESHHGEEVTQDPDPVKGAIAVGVGSERSLGPGVESERSLDLEAETGRSPGPEAGKEKGESDLVPAQDQDTGIELEAGAGQEVEVEIERRELKNQEDLAEA